jgi:hypothetical protein
MSKRTTATEATTDESPGRPVTASVDAAVTALEAGGSENVTTAKEQGIARVNDRVHISGGLENEQWINVRR